MFKDIEIFCLYSLKDMVYFVLYDNEMDWYISVKIVFIECKVGLIWSSLSVVRIGNILFEIVCKLECVEKIFILKVFLLDEICCSNGLDI